MLHEKACHSLQKLIAEVLIQELQLVFSLLRGVCWCTKLLLEEISDVFLSNLLLLCIFLFKHLNLVLHTLLFQLMLLLVLSAGEEECSSGGLLLFELLLVFFKAGGERAIDSLKLAEQFLLL